MSLAVVVGCSGYRYDTGSFREFFRTVESCFRIVSVGGGGLGRGCRLIGGFLPQAWRESR
ncbi:MAG: hypothetical protein AB1440_29385 [Pseudomonadota bacterium]